MTERFEIDVEGTTQENAVFQGDEFLCYADDVETIIEKLNELNDDNEHLLRKRGELETKNVILKEEIAKFKKWEKYIGDVKREDLDRVFEMSVYEITEAFKYYEERIKKLEKELEND